MTEPEDAREREREAFASEMPDDFARLMQEIQSAHTWAEGAGIYCMHRFHHYSRLQRELAFELIQDALAELPEFPE